MAYCAASMSGYPPSYTNSMDAYMKRSIDLRGYSSVSLSFWYIIPTLGTGDRCSVYVDQIDSAHEIFYRTVAVSSWTSSSAPDFSAYAGGIHTLIFLFHSDASSTGQGWFVDDITVTGEIATPPPTVKTLAATSITTTSGTFNGSVNANGTTTYAYFQYGSTTSYGSSTSTITYSDSSTHTFTSTLNGASPGATIHYRVTAISNGGTSFGDDASFTTLLDPPILTSVTPTSIPALKGDQEITLNGSNFQAAAYLVFTAANGDPINSTAAKLTRDSGTQIRYQINNGGDVGTWSVKVVNPDGESSSNKSFTVTSAAIQTSQATLVAPTSAHLGGSYDFHGLTGTTYFEYGATTNYGTKTPDAPQTNSANSVGTDITELTASTLYHYRLVGVAGGITTSGNDQSFTTSSSGTPVVETRLATSLTSTSAQLNGYVSPQGGSTVAYFQYGLTSAYGSTTPDRILGSTTQQIAEVIPNLSPNTLYHYRVVAISAGHFAFGDDMTFTTPTATFSLTADFGEVPLNKSTTFTGHTSPLSAESQITSWSWRFSSGETFSTQTAHPTFKASNEGWALLTVTYASGNSLSSLFPFQVKGIGNPNPQNSSASLDPVNLATGNFVMDARDLVIPGRGLPLVFERFYNSKAYDPNDSTASPGPLGWGWTHTFEIHEVPIDGGRLVFFGDGHTEKYTLSNGSYTAEPGVWNVLIQNADGTFTLTSKNQVKHIFAADDQKGRLVAIADRNGNTITVTYDDGNRRIDYITDTVGRKIQFQYDDAGQLKTLVDPIGRTVQYSVDSAHDLHSVTNPRGYPTTFTYDSYHQLLTGSDARSHVFVQNTYDDTTRTVTKQFDADRNETDFDYHFDEPPTAYTKVTRKASPQDEVTYHYHDAKLRLVKRTDGRGTDYYESFEYDDATSNLLAHVDKNGNRTEYGHNGSGDVTQVTSPDDGIVTTTYTAFHDPELRTIHKAAGDDGIKALWEYDAKGNLSDYTFPYDSVNPDQYRRSQTVNAHGQIETYTDANGHTTTFYYDSSGNNWKTLDAASHTTVREFDGIGRKTSDTDGRGNKTAYALDENGNVDETTFADGTKVVQTFDENDNRTSIEDQLHRTTYFAYDNQDHLYKTTDANGNETILGFDQLGNKVSVEQPGQGSGPVTITLGYDLAGNQISETDQLGKTRTFISDKNGNVTSETDADGVTMSYEFDSVNRRTKVIDSVGHATVTTYNPLGQITQIKDALQNLTNYTYNDAGQLATTTTVGADGNTTSAFSFGYDYEGNQTSSTHGGNKTRSVTYTPVNQVDTATDENGKTESYAYDEAGNLKTFTNGAGEVLTYEYDALNRRTSIGFPAGVSTGFTYFDDGRMKSMIDGLGTTTWTYTALGQVETATDPFGQTLSFGYDPDGNRTTVGYPGTGKVVTYAYDEANRLKSMTDWNGRVTSRDYTDAGRPSAIHFPNGVNTALGYDALGRQNDITHQKSNAAPFIRFSYGFDEVGDITSETVVHPLSPVALPQSNTYTHDNANQLLSIDGSATTHDYKGNLIVGKLSASSLTDNLTFDYQNRLTNAVIGGITTANRYDGLGHRLETTQNGATKRFVVDGTGSLAQIMAETDATGSVTAYYLHFGGLSARVLPDGAISYYHTDRNGNVSAVTDGTGSVIAAYRYDPFGVSLASSGSSQNPFRYLGGFGVYDNGDGTLFARARYYHPDLGRFLSRDPLSGSNNDGQSLNRYVYALNDPSGMIDPSGLKAVAAILAYFQAWSAEFGHQLSEFGIGFAAGYNFSLADQNLPQEGSLINRSIGNASGYVVGIFGVVESALEHAVIYTESRTATVLATEALPELKISASKYPKLAENILNAQKAGYPNILTRGGDIAANRAAALEDIPNIRGLSRDEYPFASSMEGGGSSWVGHVPIPEQNAQGALLKNFFKANNIQNSSQYIVIITP